MEKRRFATLVLTGLCPGLYVTAQAQTTVGFDDFDFTGGTPNGDFLTRSFSPDNSANNGAFAQPAFFGGVFFDRFGIMDQTVGVGGSASDASVPFDFLDATTQGVTDDRLGIFRSNDTDNFVGFADLENPDNPNSDDTVSATWTYDISGFDNLSLAVDFAAVGNFQDDEVLNITASIDGGPEQVIFAGAGTPDTPYTVTMEDGTEHNSFENIFFSESDWTNLTELGPIGTITYSDDDVDQDGFLDGATDLATGAPIRVYQETDPNNFPGDDTDFNLFTDQFVVNGVGLTNEIQTISSDITGSGSTLTLNLSAAQNGGFQFIAIDDLTITGDPISTLLLGDLSLDGFISVLDIQPFVDALSDDAQYRTDNNLTFAEFLEVADINGDGSLTVTDIQPFVDLLAGGGTSLSESQIALLNSVPEPTAAVLIALGGLAVASRRRSYR